MPLSRMKLLNQNVLWQQGKIEKKEKKISINCGKSTINFFALNESNEGQLIAI